MLEWSSQGWRWGGKEEEEKQGTLNTCKSHVWVHNNLMTMEPQQSQQFGLPQNGNHFLFFSITGKHILT